MSNTNYQCFSLFIFLLVLIIPLKSFPQYSLSWAEYYERNAYSDDNPVSAAVDNQGMIYVSGNSYGKEKKVVTLKYDTGGNLIWKSEFSTPGENDEIRSMTPGGYANIYLTGTASGDDVLLIKYSSDGELLWFRTYGIAGGEGLKTVLDISGNVYVLAECRDPITDYDVCLLKFTADGELLWARRFDGGLHQADVPADIVLDRNGDIVIAGSSDVRPGFSSPMKYPDVLFNNENINSGEFEMRIIKYSPDGSIKWDRKFRYGENSLLNVSAAVRTDYMNNILACGTVFSEISDMDYCLAAYNPDGRIIYSCLHNSSMNNTDIASSMELSPSGNIIISGTSYSGLNSGYFTVTVSPGGALKWSNVHNGYQDSRKEVKSMFVDNNGNVIITGSSASSNASSSFLTVCYNEAGRMYWNAEYSTAEGSLSSGTSVAADLHGNIIVSGFTTGRNRDFTTLKYSPAITGTGHENAFSREYSLKQNYPNPFNSSTKIGFTVPEKVSVNIKVYDMTGRFIAVIYNGLKQPGAYEINFDASGLSSGVYLYRLEAGNNILTKRMLLVK